MKITRVIGRDFLALDEVEFRLDDRGLLLVQGENLDDTSADSNGAGKSSLMDLVCWVLWGTTARGSEGDKVIRGSTKEAVGVVSLHDEETGATYEIDRTRSKGKTKLGVVRVEHGGVTTDLSQGTEKLTQAVIAKLIGSSEEVFRASVYMGQEQLVDLPKMTDRQLKTIVEEAAGVVALERAYELARANLATAKTDAAKLEGYVIGCKAEVATLRALALREDELLAEWNKNRDDEVIKLHREQDGLQLKLVDMNLAYDLALTKRIEDHIASLKAELAGYATEKRREDELRGDLSKAERVLASKAATLKVMITAIKDAKAYHDEIEGTVGTPCETCGTTMTAEHVCTASEGAKRKLALAASQMRAQQGEHASAGMVAQRAREALAAHLGAMRDPSVVAGALDAAHTSLRVQQDKAEVIAVTTRRINQITSDVAAVKARPNPHAVRLAETQATIVAEDGNIARKMASLAEAQATVGHYEQVAAVFGPAGVRAHILDTVTPYLNTRTAEYLGLLSDCVIQASWTTLVKTAKGDLREKFSIEVSHAVDARGFNELSGGEKRKVRLACAMALQDLVASRASKPFNLFVADEIDHALDDAGLERLTTVLQAKAAVTGTVVVISHNAMDCYISNVWRVIKEGGKSSLVMA